MTTRCRAVRAVLRLVVAVQCAASCGGDAASTLNPPPPRSPRVSIAPVTGRWSGATTELRTPNRYTTRVELPDSARVDEASGFVRYEGTGFGCEGLLHFVGVNQGAFTFRETIQNGACTNNGRVVLVPRSDGGLDFSYYGPLGNLSAVAVLLRTP